MSDSTPQSLSNTGDSEGPTSPNTETSATEPGSISSSKYVPPHLRATQPVLAPQSPENSHPVYKHTFTASEVDQHFGVVHGGTINSSINNHKELAYILIFLNQHPQYPPKIFIKSNLELVFKDAAQGADMNPILGGLEIPLFEEEKAAGKRVFRFKSWVRVAKAERLEKGSEGLIDMLTAKWRSDTPRRSGFEMREREKSRKGGGVAKTTERGANGEERTVENIVFKKDPDNEQEEEEKSPVSPISPVSGGGNGEGSLTQKLENTRPRSEWAWKNSLSVDWAVVTLDFIQTDKGNPLHGPRVKLATPEQKQEKLEKEIGDLLRSTESISLDDVGETNDHTGGTIRGNKGERPGFGVDGADDTITLMVNGDLDSASIPSSPMLGPVTPKKGSAINLSAYSLSKSSDSRLNPEKGRSGGGLNVSNSDISQSYISTGMEDSVVEDFGAISATSETDADESDRWSELSEREDENWMAVERGGMAKEVY
ncbi:hypothetical protein H072_2051 [Dactylellina haptotyla CBS 200.50]|uniref:Uncharacterized protein n=1 Tax=Dactylellina haptotyla (strain CBS 200.50) TaxID=1284197 RepID=S8ALP6_DACHA|nr:hypothetical protein H072_2051 [Dactylellina haptotyla CBS 200.50]